MTTFTCPRCGFVLDEASGVNMVDAALPMRAPEAGDLSVCMACAAIFEFRADGAPRWLTLEEFLRIDPQSQYEMLNVIITVLCQRESQVRHVRVPVAR